MKQEEEKRMGVSGVERQYRLVDQALSMHASLRDGYHGRAFLLNTSQIGISLILCGLAFVGDPVLEEMGLDASKTRVLFGLIATVVLLLAITEYRVDWKSRASRHDDAVKRLGRLKAEYRKELDKIDAGVVEDGMRLEDEYNRTMERLPPIPERRFATLKANHHFKVLLSKRISQNPAAPTWLLRAGLRWRGIQSERTEED